MFLLLSSVENLVFLNVVHDNYSRWRCSKANGGVSRRAACLQCVSVDGLRKGTNVSQAALPTKRGLSAGIFAVANKQSVVFIEQ